MIGDLHCHTRLSNGSCGIDDVVFYAKRAGLDFLAVTDQDTMDGCQRAAVLGKRYGLRVIPGVELSCRDDRGGEVHILCYLPAKPDRMQGLMGRTLESRNAAGREMARKVMRCFPVTEEHILRCAAGSKALYPVHIMQALLDLGYDCQIHGVLYGKLFGEEGSCYVQPQLPEVDEVLQAVHSAGGVAVLAHPTGEAELALVQRLCAKELLHGVEAYHPTLNGQQQQRVVEFAEAHGLLKTGGSGFHGSWTGTPNPLASSAVPMSCLSSMFRMGKQRTANL